MLQDEYEGNVRTALYLCAVAARLLENPGNSEVSIYPIYYCLKNIILWRELKNNILDGKSNYPPPFRVVRLLLT